MMSLLCVAYLFVYEIEEQCVRHGCCRPLYTSATGAANAVAQPPECPEEHILVDDLLVDEAIGSEQPVTAV